MTGPRLTHPSAVAEAMENILDGFDREDDDPATRLWLAEVLRRVYDEGLAQGRAEAGR